MTLRKRTFIAVFSLLTLGAVGIKYCFSSPAPAAPVSPDPRWADFNSQLSRYILRQPGVAGLYIKDLRKGLEYTYNVDRTFPSASLVKLPIMVATFQAIKEGKISLQTVVTMKRRDRRGGSGRLRFFPTGSTFTVSELLDHMIGE